MSDSTDLDKIRTLEAQIEQLRAHSREQRDDLVFQSQLNDHLIRLVQKRAAEVERANALLQEKIGEIAARRERIAVTIHDLKAPITVSLLNLELAEMEPEPEQKEFYLHSVQRELEFLLDTIASMLDLEQAASRPDASVIETVDLGGVVDGVIGRMRVLIKDKPELQLVNELPPGLPQIRGDRNKLVRVFSNLFSNAIKYTDSGAITVGGGVSDDGTAVRVFVRDTGVGIEPDRLPHLFDLFHGDAYRSDSSGVGLAFVHKAVELHGGRVTLESERGVGTCVCLELALE